MGIQNNLRIRGGSVHVSRPRISAGKVQSNLFCDRVLRLFQYLTHYICFIKPVIIVYKVSRSVSNKASIHSEIRHGILLGLIFGPGAFLGFGGSPRHFFGF